MELGINGRTAFVAGGSKGIGRAAALLLGREKCRVVVVARGQDAIDATVAEIVAAGGEAIGVSADLSTREGVAAALDVTRARFGDPDIVIGQTSEGAKGEFWDLDDEAFENAFRIFTMGAVYLARATLPAMRAKKWGRLVHIGSGTAKEPETRFPHILSNTARPSTSGLLKSLADEVAIDGVTINTVAPGWIHTPAFEEHFRKRGMTLDEGQEWLRTVIRIPAGRAGHPEEIASTVVYLCSDPAGYITGNWIVVDGGKHRSIF